MATTINLADYPIRNYNYLERMVDADDVPYFDIFLTADGAEAAHDWPDWGDVMTRQYQAAVMGRVMTGKACAIEQRWQRQILSRIEADGMLYRPATAFSKHEADHGDASLTIFALATAAIEQNSETLAAAVRQMVRELTCRLERNTVTHQGPLGPFIIKGLMVAARHLHCPEALELARRLSRQAIDNPALFSPDNHFRHGGHMHGNLRALLGMADYALWAGDAVMFSRIDAIYNFVVRETTTRFGFIQESTSRTGDIVGCETCTLMDYLGLAVTLANHGHPEYWDNVERIVRNQLIENQYTGGGWFQGRDVPDTALNSTRHLDERLVGAYAGWSSPTHFLAAHETLDAHWGNWAPHLGGRVRALQNCCGGSGTHAFFIAWKNSARFEHGTLKLHLHLDKLLPEAEIRGYQPWEGRTEITLKQAAALQVRIPDFIPAGTVPAVTLNRKPLPVEVHGNYWYAAAVPAGSRVEYRYEIPEYTTREIIGNPGARHYAYQVTWKGSTVVEMKPVGRQYKLGYSEFDHKNVPVFFGAAGPAPLYQRAAMRRKTTAVTTPLTLDEGKLDLWANLAP